MENETTDKFDDNVLLDIDSYIRTLHGLRFYIRGLSQAGGKFDPGIPAKDVEAALCQSEAMMKQYKRDYPRRALKAKEEKAARDAKAAKNS